MKTLIFTVTNDLSYDQRMQRICGSLAARGHEVLLVGRMKKHSIPLTTQPYRQKRLSSWFQKGPAMYIEFNTRLFFYLLFLRMDLICAIDLDTILPCLYVSVLRGKPRVYDAHELFTEMKEIVSRPLIYRYWTAIERMTVPRFKHGYTVNQSLADEFRRRYGVEYQVVRNLPVLTPTVAEPTGSVAGSPFIIYQGAVNEGRSFETIIPAMQQVDATLLICGEGNYFEKTQALIRQYQLENKVMLRGYVPPRELKSITPKARAALMIFEATGMNQFHSLSNRFFDYIMAGVPQVCVNYPEYKAINDEYNVALMIEDTRAGTIANALNRLLQDDALYNTLHLNCLKAREKLNWRSEENTLFTFYEQLFQTPPRADHR